METKFQLSETVQVRTATKSEADYDGRLAIIEGTTDRGEYKVLVLFPGFTPIHTSFPAAKLRKYNGN